MVFPQASSNTTHALPHYPSWYLVAFLTLVWWPLIALSLALFDRKHLILVFRAHASETTSLVLLSSFICRVPIIIINDVISIRYFWVHYSKPPHFSLSFQGTLHIPHHQGASSLDALSAYFRKCIAVFKYDHSLTRRYWMQPVTHGLRGQHGFLNFARNLLSNYGTAVG